MMFPWLIRQAKQTCICCCCVLLCSFAAALAIEDAVQLWLQRAPADPASHADTQQRSKHNANTKPNAGIGGDVTMPPVPAALMYRLAERLSAACQPLYLQLLLPVSQHRAGIKFLVDLRADLLALLKEQPAANLVQHGVALRALDQDLRYACSTLTVITRRIASLQLNLPRAVIILKLAVLACCCKIMPYLPSTFIFFGTPQWYKSQQSWLVIGQLNWSNVSGPARQHVQQQVTAAGLCSPACHCMCETVAR